jgi:acetoacetyl-CoA reductase
MTDKKQRIALITGGIGGIGSAISKHFLAQGYFVIANYYPALEDEAKSWLERRKQDSKSTDYAVVPGDVSSYKSCEEMAAYIQKEIGVVDTIVNCAGITRDKTIKGMTEDMWREVIDINLTGMFNVTKQFVVPMSEAGFGRIVNISSVNGQRGQFGQVNYSAAKAGVHGFTMALAQEMVRKGVTVNTISPGYVATPMTEAMPQEVLDAIVAQVPIGRMAKPEEIAYAVSVLCDEQAAYITGANIPVNGGMFMSF